MDGMMKNTVYVKLMYELYEKASYYSGTFGKAETICML